MASGTGSLDIASIVIEADQLAPIIANMYQEWVDYRKQREAIWKEVRDNVHATDTRQLYPGARAFDNTTHIPKITQISDNLEANYEPALFPQKKWFKFEANDEGAADASIREKIEAYLETKHKLSDFYPEMKKALVDWKNTGNAFVGVEYVRRTRLEKKGNQEQEVVTYQGPRVYRISPHDIVFNPAADSFEKSPKIIRTLYTIGELHRLTEESPEEWPQEVLDKALELRSRYSSASRTDKRRFSGLQFDGFGTAGEYLRSGYVEVLTFYGDIYVHDSGEFLKNQRIVIVDRKWVAHKEELQTWSGHPLIFHSAWRIQADNLWGQGPLEQLLGMQFRLNHLENARADSFDQQLSPDLVMKGMIDTLDDNGRTIYISEDVQGDVARLAPEATILQVDFQIETLMRWMEELAGAPREAMGIRTPGEKTAFEVSAMNERSSKVFQNKIRYFEQTIIEPVLNAELELARTYLSGVDTVQFTSDEDGVIDFLDITPEDIQSNGRLTPVGARHFAQQNILMQNLQQVANSFLQDPSVKMHISGKALAKVVINDVLGYSNMNLYQPYIQVQEQMEAQKFMNAAQQEVGEQEARRAGMLEEDPSMIPEEDFE